jgi:uncharacterized membrane protein YdjX (TVP38/TMEM64 family)
MKSGTIKLIIIGAIVIGLFFLSSYLFRQYTSFFESIIGKQNLIGAFTFEFLNILDVLLLPVFTIPLLPIVSNLYGIIVTGIITAAGWFMGSMIAFFIARKFRKRILKVLLSKEQEKSFRTLLPKKNLLFLIVLIRIFLPLDVGSYALGLSRRVNTKLYITALFIGVVIPAFFFAYLGGLSILYQALWISAGVILIIIFYLIFYRKK